MNNRFQLIRFSYVDMTDDYQEKIAYAIDQFKDDTYLIDDKGFFANYYEAKSLDSDIEMKWSVEIEADISDLETIQRLYEIHEVAKYEQSVYYREKHYGGSEEGGWYYSTLELSDEKKDDVSIGLNEYGEGYIVYNEHYVGQNEKKAKQFYC